MEYKGYYISKTEDCGENEGGLYCQIFRASDTNHDEELDHFCVHVGEDFEEVAKKAVEDLLQTQGEGFRKIQDLYEQDDVCMYDLLGAIKCSELGDLTLEQAFELYIEAKKWADGDKFYVEKEDKREEL